MIAGADLIQIRPPLKDVFKKISKLKFGAGYLQMKLEEEENRVASIAPTVTFFWHVHWA